MSLSRARDFLRSLRRHGSDKPTGFLWVEPGRLAASAYPASKRQVKWLAKQGINAILTLTEAPLPAEWVQGSTINLEHVPMKGAHQPIELESLRKAVSIVQAQVNDGRKVLVHCHYGQGRTMTVLASYFVMERKISPQEAIQALRAMRPGAVEKWQEKAVFDYAETTKQNTPEQN